MSSSEVQYTYALLQQIESLLNRIDVQADTTSDKLTRTVVSVELVERSLGRLLTLSRRVVGNETIDSYLMKLQQAVIILNQLRIAAAMLTATNPWLIPLAGLTFMSIAFQLGSYS